jgi:hypothetical protein
MRTFRRSLPEYATGLFEELEGKDITTATIQVGLAADTRTLPAAWLTPSVVTRPTPSTARVSLLIDTGIPVGRYVLWVKVTDTPEILPRPAVEDLLNVV